MAFVRIKGVKLSTVQLNSVQCVECGKERGKKAKPWRNCTDCNGVLCLYCRPAHRKTLQCGKCLTIKYEAEMKKEKETPVECQKCHHKKLPDEMTNPYVPVICKDCDKKEQDAKATARAAAEMVVQNAWVPGTLRKVVVGNYTYESDLPLKIGTKVLLPSSWVDDLHGNKGPNESVVTSFISDYDGPCKRILGIYNGPRQAQPESPQRKLLKDLKFTVDGLLKQQNIPDNWYVPILDLISKGRT